MRRVDQMVISLMRRDRGIFKRTLEEIVKRNLIINGIPKNWFLTKPNGIF